MKTFKSPRSDDAPGDDIPSIVDNALLNLGRLRLIVDGVHYHHKDNTDNGQALLLDIVEIHEQISGVVQLLDEIGASACVAIALRNGHGPEDPEVRS